MKLIFFSAEFDKEGDQLFLKKACLKDSAGESLELDGADKKTKNIDKVLNYIDSRPCVFVGFDCTLEWASFLSIFEKEIPPIIPSFCFDLKQKVLEISDKNLTIRPHKGISCKDKCSLVVHIYAYLLETHGFEIPIEDLLDKKQQAKNSILDEPQKELNPELWVESSAGSLPRLKDELRNKIILFAKRKSEEFGISVKHLFLFGGSASFQYTDKSDIDCVIYGKNFAEEDYENINSGIRKEKEKYGEHDISLYLKPLNAKPLEIADAVYDVLNNSWVIPPLVLPRDFDPDSFFSPLVKEAERVCRSFDLKFARLIRIQNEIDSKNTSLNQNPQQPTRIKRDVKDLKDEQFVLVEDLVDNFHMLHEQRQSLHRKLEEKILSGESVSRYSRFQSPEIVWKYLDKHKYLDRLKKLESWVEQHYSERILKKEKRVQETGEK